MEPPTVPHVYTPDDLLTDRRARRQADAIATPAEALSVADRVLVGVAIGCAVGSWIAALNQAVAAWGAL